MESGSAMPIGVLATMGGIGAVVAQTKDKSMGLPDSAAWVLGTAILVLVVVMAFIDYRRNKQIQELRTVQARANGIADQNAERDQRAYAQHIALNDLAVEKMKLEIQYLQLQSKLGELEVDSRARADEFHRLMSEKTRFEIQSLKLHIREQNKRLDDYTGFNDDE